MIHHSLSVDLNIDHLDYVTFRIYHLNYGHVTVKILTRATNIVDKIINVSARCCNYSDRKFAETMLLMPSGKHIAVWKVLQPASGKL